MMQRRHRFLYVSLRNRDGGNRRGHRWDEGRFERRVGRRSLRFRDGRQLVREMAEAARSGALRGGEFRNGSCSAYVLGRRIHDGSRGTTWAPHVDGLSLRTGRSRNGAVHAYPKPHCVLGRSRKYKWRTVLPRRVSAIAWGVHRGEIDLKR